MSDAEKSGRITLRMDAALHADLADLASRMGMDLNGLINFMLRKALPEVVLMADYWEMTRRPAFSSSEQWRKAKKIAAMLNMDCFALLSDLLTEALPALQARADAVKRKTLAVRYGVPEGHVPLVHIAVAVGWGRVNRKGLLKEMKEEIATVCALDDPALQAIALAAERELAAVEAPGEYESSYTFEQWYEDRK